MSASKKVAVVSGANKGIGFAIVELLAKEHEDWTIYLCARDKTRGETALDALKKKGLNNIRFHLLDVVSSESADALAAHIKKDEGGVDVLINNAGISLGFESQLSKHDQAKVTIATNYTGLLNVCRAIFPLLRTHGRVVHVASRASAMALPGCSDARKKEIMSNELTEEQLTRLMEAYIEATKDGKHVEAGWPDNAYGVSKIGAQALGGVQQRFFDKTRPNDDIIVNSCCPGLVETDLSSEIKFEEKRTIYQGAETPIYLATLPDNTKSPRGEMVAECKIIGWEQIYPDYIQKFIQRGLDAQAMAKGELVKPK